MKQFYAVTTAIKEALEASPHVNVVRFGDVFDIDFEKQAMYPLSNVMVNQATISERVIKINLSVTCMDLVDESKEDPREQKEPFYGTNNEQDVLNTQLAVLNELTQTLRRGQLYRDMFQLEGEPTCVPFSERFTNLLAGWTGTFDVVIPNNEIAAC
jgi:hypothetical protein